MHELRIERSVNTHGLFDLMRCNIRSVNSTLRTARALNDPYQSDELKLFSTDRKGLQRSVRIQGTESAFKGTLQCGSLEVSGHLISFMVISFHLRCIKKVYSQHSKAHLIVIQANRSTIHAYWSASLHSC